MRYIHISAIISVRSVIRLALVLQTQNHLSLATLDNVPRLDYGCFYTFLNFGDAKSPNPN